ncbi:MAG: hypothetical protein P4L92_05770 [Rudaea sp.]|nr:hypothetical protein [Rudaea sp.]
MNTAVLLRIAAVIALFQFLAHTTMFVTYTPAHGPDETQVVQMMQSHVYSFSGSPRSYWDMYFGYGLFSAFNCLIEAALLWMLAAIAKENAPRTRPIAALFLFANVGYTALVWKYFFPLPSYFDIALALVLGLAILVAPRGGAKRNKGSVAQGDAVGI